MATWTSHTSRRSATRSIAASFEQRLTDYHLVDAPTATSASKSFGALRRTARRENVIEGVGAGVKQE